MPRRKLIKSLIKKFKWKFLFLFCLTFFISYIAFLFRFNLINNLSHHNREERGHFFYLLGKCSLIKKTEGSKIFVDWNKLLLILFLLYFPLKIIIQLILNYWQKNYEREIKVYLTKKILFYTTKNQDLIRKEVDEKIYIINEIVPKFSHQFIIVLVGLFEILVDISFAVLNLYFLVNSVRSSQLVSLLVIFILVNLIWLAFFYYSFSSSRTTNLRKKYAYQDLEKNEIKNWLEDPHFANHSRNTNYHKSKERKLSKLLDNNSQQIKQLNLFSALFQLPELIISGIGILFLFLYYQVYCGGEGDLGWDIYFIANNLQTIFFRIKRGFSLLPAISTCQENYQKIAVFC